MPLNIFEGDTDTNQTSSWADDIVGTFRAGKMNEDGTPVSLDKWRVTTGDPEVADAIADLFEGTEPAEWESKGEESLEVYTDVDSVTVILEDARAVSQQFVLRTRDGDLVYTSDGATILRGEDEGQPDPDAARPLSERLERGAKGIGPKLETSIVFRLEDVHGSPIRAGDLGLFRFRSSGKSIGKAILRDKIEDKLAKAGGPVRARLYIENVSFVAKNGPRAGKTVSYNTAALKLLGAVK